jgi:hypothetical protein
MTYTVLKLLLFITVYLSLDTFLTLHSIRHDSDQALKNSESLIEKVGDLDQIKQNTDRIVVCHDFPNVDSINLRFNKVLRTTFAPYIQENADFFRDGIAEGRVTFQLERFKPAYLLSLKYLLETYKEKQPSLLATSLAKKDYFWTYQGPLNENEGGIRSFVAGGGYNKRVFLVERDWENDPYAVSIMNRQVDSMHVDVWYLPKSAPAVPEYFVVSKEGDFMWEVRVDDRGAIGWGTYHTSKPEIAKYLKKFEEVEKHFEIKKYTPRPLPKPIPITPPSGN